MFMSMASYKYIWCKVSRKGMNKDRPKKIVAFWSFSNWITRHIVTMLCTNSKAHAVFEMFCFSKTILIKLRFDQVNWKAYHAASVLCVNKNLHFDTTYLLKSNRKRRTNDECYTNFITRMWMFPHYFWVRTIYRRCGDHIISCNLIRTVCELNLVLGAFFIWICDCVDVL